jgi:glycyl-tRNA synthetase beta chain
MLEDAGRLAKTEGLKLRRDPALFAEVAGLIEWPVALIGRIDDAFMDVPAEVLTESMRAHQKYFALETEDGALAPYFITIANMMTDDGGKSVVTGNERVLRARLSDARFFWDQDRKAKLESRVAKLRGITYHAKLGTVADKVDRMESLAAALCEFIPDADRNMATRAAHLAKADLTTGMVGEFPELQGLMGRYYALNDGEDAGVADAIAQHYAPKGPGDDCPVAPTAIAVALTDKIDSLVAFFAINEKPTGSRDPFALRRAALGVIRIVTENKLRLPLMQIFKTADGKNALDASDMLAFFADRLKVQMREKGTRHDLIEAVFALGGEDDLVRLLARVDALTALLGTDDGANLLTAYKRAANIVAIEEKKDKQAYDGPVDESLLVEPQEKRLNEVLGLEEKALALTIGAEKFGDAMAALAHLREPVDAFFDHVTVNCEDQGLRANRLRLLSRIRAALHQVADFSKIEG